ncbi:RHS repeat-associated core domain-containing protein [Longimicrobium terrae]|uniref:RHS repeat-associated core domain-containing protein n=1 Tax=Longimicrobium terrae TaxID=1639882 RepID=UPI00197B758A
MDAGSRLYYLRARWYDPDLGRFVSEDPIGLAGGINPYAYIGSSPTNGTDPSGLCTPSSVSGWSGNNPAGGGLLPIVSFVASRVVCDWRDQEVSMDAAIDFLGWGGGGGPWGGGGGWTGGGASTPRSDGQKAADAVQCIASGAEVEYQIGTVATAGANAAFAGAEATVDVLSVKLSADAAGHWDAKVTSGVYGNFTLPLVTVNWGWRSEARRGQMGRYRWVGGLRMVQVPGRRESGSAGGNGRECKSRQSRRVLAQGGPIEMSRERLVLAARATGIVSAVLYIALCAFAVYVGLHPKLADVYTGRYGEPGWQAPIAAMFLLLPLCAAVLWLALDTTIPPGSRRRWMVMLVLFNVGTAIVFLLTRRSGRR